MGKLLINQNLITAQNAGEIAKICPFGAIEYNGEKLEITSACKMCKLCAKKSGGAIEYVEEEEKKPLFRVVVFSIYCSAMRYFFLTEKAIYLPNGKFDII